MWARLDEKSRPVEFIDFDPMGKFVPEWRFVPVPEGLRPWIDGSYIWDGAAFAEPEPGYTLARARAAKIREIDARTSAAVLAGFEYAIRDETLHFSYDQFDQGNFTDAAGAAILATMMRQNRTVTWNAYRADGELVRLILNVEEFLDLFTNGALAHKAARMAAGGERKEAAEAAQNLAALAEI